MPTALTFIKVSQQIFFLQKNFARRRTFLPCLITKPIYLSVWSGYLLVGKDEGVGRFQGTGKAQTDHFSPWSPRHQQLTALGLPEPLHCTSLLSVYFSCIFLA